jgi:hypothetical protein
VTWRFLPRWWGWGATIGNMCKEQTVLLVTVRDDGSGTGDHLTAKLRSIMNHPQYQRVVTFTEERFPLEPGDAPGR